MPPDPILALLSFAGLLVYGAIGGVVGASVLRLTSPKRYFAYLGGDRHYDYPGEVWAAFISSALLWPGIVAAAIPVVVLALPFLVAKTVGGYVAKAQLERAS